MKSTRNVNWGLWLNETLGKTSTSHCWGHLHGILNSSEMTLKWCIQVAQFHEFLSLWLSHVVTHNTTTLWSHKCCRTISYSFLLSPKPLLSFQLRLFCPSLSTLLLTILPFQYHQGELQSQLNMFIYLKLSTIQRVIHPSSQMSASIYFWTSTETESLQFYYVYFSSLLHSRYFKFFHSYQNIFHTLYQFYF